MIPKRHKDTDIASEVAQGRLFRQRLQQLAEDVAQRFMKGEELNAIIADVAKRENFNRLKIQRLVEESNTLAYNKRYDQLRREKDRRITFELAELGKIIELMGLEAPVEEDNPNWVTGEKGVGEMNKAASEDVRRPHHPHDKVAESRERTLEKQAKAEAASAYRERVKLERDVQSGLFKIANAIVMSERARLNGSKLFNTLISDATLSDATIAGIQKKAQDITSLLVSTKRVSPRFSIDLSVDHHNKVANLVLGEHSLLNGEGKMEAPKVQPTSDIANYRQLIDLAKQIEAEQSRAIALGAAQKEVQK